MRAERAETGEKKSEKFGIFNDENLSVEDIPKFVSETDPMAMSEKPTSPTNNMFEKIISHDDMKSIDQRSSLQDYSVKVEPREGQSPSIKKRQTNSNSCYGGTSG